MSTELINKYSVGEIQFPTKSGLLSMLVKKRIDFGNNSKNKRGRQIVV